MDNCPPILIENACGKGIATLMTAWDYPGAESLRNLFKVILKAILSAEQRKARIKVIGNDKIRYAIYPENGLDTLYILNTDYNHKNIVTVCNNDIALEIKVNSCEMRTVYISDGFICSPCDNTIALEEHQLNENKYHLFFKGTGSHGIEWSVRNDVGSIWVNHTQLNLNTHDEHFITNHEI